MITITRQGDLGPLDALELRKELAGAARSAYRDVVLDLTDVISLHPAAVAAIVAGATRIRNSTGSFELLEPAGPSARRTLGLVSMSTLLR
jgi:anti-anti-sigma regulatory factor